MIDPIPTPDDQPKPDMDLNDALAELQNTKATKPKIIPVETAPSQSQLAAAIRLENLYKLKLLGASAGGMQVRTHALVCGGSGSGKTTAVRIFAGRSRLPVFATNIGSWIPTGAKREPNTLEQISQFIRLHRGGIVFLDEIDKLTARLAGEQYWSTSVTLEILALLDGDARLESMGFSASDRSRLQHNFLLVAAGAWQSVWTDLVKQEEAAPVEAYVERITQESGLPEELFFRFAQPLLAIASPEQPELKEFILRIHRQSETAAPSADQLNDLAVRAAKSGRAMRYLEDYATSLLVGSSSKYSLPELLNSLEPMKAAQSFAHFIETKSEAQKRLYTSLRFHGDELEQTAHELSQLLAQVSERHLMKLHHDLSFCNSDLGGENSFGFSVRDLDEIPTLAPFRKEVTATPQNQRKLMKELKTAFRSVGESSVAYLCLGDEFLNKRHESRVLSYGGWLAERLITVLDGPAQADFPRKLKDLLWHFVRQHRNWKQVYNELVAILG